MAHVADRISSGDALGRAGRRFDLALGVSAAIPVVVAAVVVWLIPGDAAAVVRTLAVIWASGLLAFFAGVRRGLTFSEAGGGRAPELATMLLLFGVGMLAMLLCNAGVAAAGLAAVGLLDARAAHRREAPHYFTLFRLLQMGACTLAMLAIQLRGA